MTELEESYDDNIFRSNTGEVSDYITKFRPSLKLTSDWANHALNFNLGAEIARNALHGSEDYEDFNAGVDGKIDIDEGDTINLGASAQRGHDQRGSLNDTGAATPTKYYNYAIHRRLHSRCRRHYVAYHGDRDAYRLPCQ